jgi:hypothetical protein
MKNLGEHYQIRSLVHILMDHLFGLEQFCLLIIFHLHLAYTDHDRLGHADPPLFCEMSFDQSDETPYDYNTLLRGLSAWDNPQVFRAA